MGAVIVGTRLGVSSHVDDNLNVFRFTLDEEDLAIIDEAALGGPGMDRARAVFKKLGAVGANTGVGSEENPNREATCASCRPRLTDMETAMKEKTDQGASPRYVPVFVTMAVLRGAGVVVADHYKIRGMPPRDGKHHIIQSMMVRVYF